MIPEAYGDEPGVLRASLIQAMADWIKRHPDTDRGVMIETLQEIDLDELEKDARAYRAIEGKRVAEAIMLVLEKKYNSMRAGRLNSVSEDFRHIGYCRSPELFHEGLHTAGQISRVGHVAVHAGLLRSRGWSGS